MWSLYILYRSLNYITRPFKLPLIKCVYAILYIGKERHRL